MVTNSRKLLSTTAAVVMLALLAGCPRAVRPPEPARPAPEAPREDAGSDRQMDLTGAEVYRIDPTASTLDILVFRGGTLGRFGHNHVISARSLAGRAWVHPQLARSGFEASFPVEELEVDDPQRRAAAGSEFPPQVPQADREGTRRNMLKAELLDAAAHPRITLRSMEVSGTLQSPRVLVRVTIKGVSRDVPVEMQLQMTDASVRARGELAIRQTDFGITPFSAALGALQVQDELRVRFDIVAPRR